MNDADLAGRTPGRPRRVLIAVDRSTASQHALDFARHLFVSGDEVRIVSVAENPRTLFPTGSASTAFLDAARAELAEGASKAVAEARQRLAHGEVQVDAEIIELAKHGGNLVDALLDAANAWRAELLIVGAREHHGWLSRWVEGTVSVPLARLVPCPILVVPARGGNSAHRSPHRVLFAVDGSRQSMDALGFGLTLVGAGADLRAIYVVDRAVRFTDFVPVTAVETGFIEEGEQALNVVKPILAKVSSRSTVAVVSTARVDDDVAHAIIREAKKWRADLIVMGTHGRRGMARWLLGSVAGRVARATPIPLLLVNPRAS